MIAMHSDDARLQRARVAHYGRLASPPAAADAVRSGRATPKSRRRLTVRARPCAGAVWFRPTGSCRAMRCFTRSRSVIRAPGRCRRPRSTSRSRSTCATSPILRRAPAPTSAYSVDGGRTFDRPENLWVVPVGEAPRLGHGGRLHPYPLAPETCLTGEGDGARALSCRREIVQSPGWPPRARIPIDSEFKEVFGPQGPLARVIPGYAYRPEQAAMAAAVGRALALEKR